MIGDKEYIHPHQKVVRARVDGPAPDIVDRYRRMYTGLIADHLGKAICCHREISPIQYGMRVCGPAVTAAGPDLSVRRMAIDLARPGDVLVVAAGGDVSYSCFGDGTASRMMLKDMEGVVIDGLSRDVAGIRSLGFPTFARGSTPRNFHYPQEGGYGAVNVPVNIGGVTVNPGDLVFGDDDGVVVVPKDLAEELISEIEKNFIAEVNFRGDMKSYQPFDVVEILRSRGYRFEEGSE